MGLYLLDREPPLDPPEPEVAFYCADCGGEIYIGETYFRVDGKNYCEGCVSTEIAEPDYDDDGPDPDQIYDDWRDRQMERDDECFNSV